MATLCPKHNVERDKWSHCPLCKRESDKKYDTSKRGLLLNNERTKKYQNTPEGRLKNSAHQSVLLAVRKGLLVRKPCVICSNPNTDAHHAWGYSKEHRLHVVFLCHKHHALANKDPVFNEKLKLDFPPCA
jgi:hypothetical protein